MVKIVFIQGIHNYRLRGRFITDVSEATGMEVIHFDTLYGLFETHKHQELIDRINSRITGSDDRFIVLAHSFGGILAYCLSDEAYMKIDKIVTFGSPHAVPFRWFRNLKDRLPYRLEVPVAHQESHGFFLDVMVPFIFTKHPKALAHRNVAGTHTFVPNRKAYFRGLVLGTD